MIGLYGMRQSAQRAKNAVPNKCNQIFETDDNTKLSCLRDMVFVGDFGTNCYWMQCRSCRTGIAYSKSGHHVFENHVYRGPGKATPEQRLEYRLENIQRIKEMLTGLETLCNDESFTKSQSKRFQNTISILRDQLETAKLG